MKTLLKSIVLAAILGWGQAFSQSASDTLAGRIPPRAPSYLALLFNIVTTTVDAGPGTGAWWDPKESTRGLQFGVSAQFGLTRHVSFVNELYFLVKGGPADLSSYPVTGKHNYRFRTLEMPALARIHFGRFHLNVGPSLSYTLAAKLKTENGSMSLPFGTSAGQFKRFDAGLQFGAGYRFKGRHRDLVLDVRYSHGLTNIASGQEMYNRYLNISLQFVRIGKIF